MIKVKVPIPDGDIERAIDTARNTSLYLIEQAERNIDDALRMEEKVVKFIEFIQAFKEKGKGKIHFAARGRSLYLGARTLASRMVQLNIPTVYPTLEDHITYNPTATITGDDCVICFSTSGETASVVKKASFAKSMGCDVIAFTANIDSTLAKIAGKNVILLPAHSGKDEVLKKYDPKPFTPLGTTSEYTQLIFAEALARALKDVIEGEVDSSNAPQILEKTAKRMLNKAKRNMENSFKQCEEIISLISNLLLKYYSQQTVHLYARGKSFDMVIGPFKMRLDQIPHAFVTGILDFEPLNRPVRKGQICIMVSGSGAVYPLAERVIETGCMLASVTSYENKLYELSHIRIIIPGRKPETVEDWDIRQWKGFRSEFAPEGIEFEISAAAFFDGIFGGLASYIGITEDDMRMGHANIQ
ncbi:hypothetical protein DRO02_01895 [archaeon]|nr:MAG: hypothetical protein DRO21_05040 [archaeon]RLG65432.1 MAG: hypothetical protein DRO02_01895 [archaeon]